MIYLIIIGTILSTIGILTFVKGRQYIKQTIEQIEIAHKQEIQESYAQEQEELKQFQANKERLIADLAREHEAWKIRAREARESTEQLIQSESKRFDAELGKRRELEEIKQQQYQEQRQKLLEQEYEQKKQKIEAEIIFLKAQLGDFRARQEAVNEAILREKELKEQEDFYSIQISDNDKEDIAYLQSMDLKLHNRNVIPKLIWDLYIRRPVQEMIKRVTGGKKTSGIYKITNKKTGESYIGRTTDFSTRWTNHCKTAIGLEGAARTILHNRMAQDGIWGYTFEILEEVDKNNLSAREAFYIDLYGTKNQLNMKSGDKNETQ